MQGTCTTLIDGIEILINYEFEPGDENLDEFFVSKIKVCDKDITSWLNTEIFNKIETIAKDDIHPAELKGRDAIDWAKDIIYGGMC
jgi:hypothetical protein